MNKGSYLPIIIIACTALLSLSILPIINKKKKPGEANYLSAWNPAEKVFLEKSRRKMIYPGERIPVIETDNLCSLGKLSALTFLHWVCENPRGVIALPTGKTPETFIEYLRYYKQHWNDSDVRKDLKRYGIRLETFPQTKGLKFVQLDEFYPIRTEQKNSYTSYVNQYYLNLLEIPPENVLGMDLCQVGILKDLGPEKVFPEGKIDLTLAEREPQNSLEALQKKAIEEAKSFCASYEDKIRKWGGIGFFIGGIGPDGHIAFNMPGSSHSSKTRLVKLDYPTAAAAANDLGGIEYSKDKTAITIGLDTIKFKEDATIIIMAAGEAKAPVVADAIQNSKHTDYPGTAFQNMKGARFYLTQSAASQLESRRLEDLQKKRWNQLSIEEIDDVVIELALWEKKRLVDLKKADFMQYPKSAALMRKYKEDIRDLINEVRARLIAKIELGLKLPERCYILHTGPHHDDIMLSYHSVMCKIMNKNVSYFAYATSGFNSVTNRYMLETLNRIPEYSLDAYIPEIFKHDYAFILRRFINAAEMGDRDTMARTESIIMLKNICCVFDLKTAAELKQTVSWLKNDYFPYRVPGEKDIVEVQALKGAMRESESERMLLMAGVPLPRIRHLRAKFYNGEYFNPMPTIEEDAKPVLDLFTQTRPKVITVAFDPEGTGPDTHYKVLQVVAQAVRMGKLDPDLKVWGYRNVWHRFKLSEANLMAPVSDEDIEKMNHTFMTCFTTQKTASFPPANYDGPFSGLAEKIQREQYDQLKTLLGEGYFIRHKNPAVRNASGFVFIRQMSKDEFVKTAQELKNRVEL